MTSVVLEGTPFLTPSLGLGFHFRLSYAICEWALRNVVNLILVTKGHHVFTKQLPILSIKGWDAVAL